MEGIDGFVTVECQPLTIQRTLSVSYGWPKRARYSGDEINASTISAFTKLPIKLIQLTQPECIPGLIRISLHVAEVFQLHKCPVGFLRVERLAVAGGELLISFRNHHDSIHYLLQHVRSACRRVRVPPVD